MISRLRQWLRRGAAAPDIDRWVVLDVESSGLDARRDRLIAIAALAVRTGGERPAIGLGDSFEAVLRQPEPAVPADKANILLHGIGQGAQQAGLPPEEALQAFAAFAGASPLLAFHAPFDRTLIERACRAVGLPRPANPWLDLEPLAAVLNPQVRARSLDEWMAHFGIRCLQRHQAAADTLATAELLLKLWPALRTECPRPRFDDAVALAAQRRWLQR